MKKKGVDQSYKSIVFTHDGNKFALGMEWVIHNQNNSRALKDIKGGAYGVKIALPNNMALTGVCTAQANDKVYSGALIAAMNIEMGVLILPCSEQKFWVLLVSKGQPIEGYDNICSSEELKDHVAKIHSLFANITIYGDVEICSEHWPEKDVIPTSYGDIFTKEYVAKKYRLSRQKRKYITYTLYPSLVASLAIFGYAVSQLFNSEPVQNITQSIAQKDWEDQALLSKQGIIREFSSSAVNYPIDRWLSRIFKTLNKIPLEAGGWHFKSLACGDSQMSCTIIWENTGYGTFKSLTKNIKTIGPVNLIDPEMAEQSINIVDHIPAEFDENSILSHIQGLPDIEDFKLSHVSTLQLLGSIPAINYTVKSPENTLSLPPLGVGVSKTITFPGLGKGHWSLSGKSIQLLNDSVIKLDSNVFFVRNLTLNITYSKDEIDTDWNLEGVYAIKS